MLPVMPIRMCLAVELAIAEKPQKGEIGFAAKTRRKFNEVDAAAGRDERRVLEAGVAQEPIGHAPEPRPIALQHAALQLQLGGIAQRRPGPVEFLADIE